MVAKIQDGRHESIKTHVLPCMAWLIKQKIVISKRTSIFFFAIKSQFNQSYEFEKKDKIQYGH